MGRLRIFLCYRRDDTRWVAGRLYDELRQRYGHEQVFQDVTDIRPGSRYTDQIQEEISRCDVLVVVMGEGWSSATDRQGRRRLDSSHDLVRLEIATALQRRIPIIPVLVQRASMPADVELPDDIADLALYSACEVTDTRWEYDVGVLLTAIDGLAGESVPAETTAVGEQAGTIRRQQAKRDAEREAEAKAEEQAERSGRGRITPPGRPRLALLLVMALGLAAVAVGVIYGRDGAEPQVATTGGPSTRGSTQTTRPPSTTSFAVGGDSWKATKIFEDRFSDRKAGWETVDNATHTLGYKNGAYEVTAKQPGNHVAFPRADPQLSSPDDVVIGVRARRLAGTRGNGYGITFRYRDSRNYYWFNITNEGGRSLNKIVNGNWVRLVWPKVTDGIISPTGLNHIEVMCTESGGGSARLVVWVNGKQLVDYTDKDPLEPGGRVGLFGYNAGQGPSTWTYDDFSVWELRG